MGKIKPWIGRFLNTPKNQYIMNFIEFIEVGEKIKDLQSDIRDIDDLFDDKKDIDELVDEKKVKNKKYNKTKLDFEKRKERIRQAGIAAAQGSGFDQLLP
jgi:tRNA G10  N-methylase Trm11